MTNLWLNTFQGHNNAANVPKSSPLPDAIADQCLWCSGSAGRRGLTDGRNTSRVRQLSHYMERATWREPTLGGFNMSKRLTAALLIGAFTASTAALAQGVSFETIDSNQDGFVSFDEVAAVVPDMSEDVFKAADANQDNLLDPAEFAAVQP